MSDQTQKNLDSYGTSLSLDLCQVSEASTCAIETISRAASKHGIEAYLVGGIVREIVARLPKITTSPDITIIGDAAKFAQVLTVENTDCSWISASQLHTAKVKIGTVTIDIASARTDIYEPWGALPQITPVNNIETDLQRRDFTVNAMAIHLMASGIGDLIDPFDGRIDAANGIMRVIRERFVRRRLHCACCVAVRLAARYGYTFDAETAGEIQRSLASPRKNVRQIATEGVQRISFMVPASRKSRTP